MQGSFIFCNVVDAMGNHLAVAETGEVMVVDDRWLDAVGDTFAIEIPQHFLLFCVHANDRLACIEILLLHFSNVFKLGIAIGMLADRLLFLSLAATIAFVLKQSLDNVFAHGCSHVAHLFCNLTPREIRPFDVRTHRVARSVILQDRAEVFDDFRRCSFRLLAAAVFFRWRLRCSGVGGLSISVVHC